MKNLAFITLAWCTMACLLMGCPGMPVDGELMTTRIAAGFDKPTWYVQFPNDPDHALVLEQTSGHIREINDGEVAAEPYLNLRGIVSRRGGEHGILCLAFHPNYTANGFFYLSYTDNDTEATIIARYTTDPETGDVDPQSEVRLLAIDQPTTLHNGGMIAFGPDGYLYIGSGDGGGSGDPNNTGQRLDTLLGKILRIDVDGGAPYAIPASNPFVDDENALDEIWAYGMRNPWRFSFDRDTGDLYIGDVGEQKREEISFQPSSSVGGENYGWSIAEGFTCRDPDMGTQCGTRAGFTPPIYDYEHGLSRSVTGGYVYRGAALGEEFQGLYFFADFITGQIWTFRYDGENVTELVERTAELAPSEPSAIDQVVSFYEDANGELYIVDFDGEIFRIVPNTNGGGGGPFNFILFIEEILNAIFPGLAGAVAQLFAFFAALFGF